MTLNVVTSSPVEDTAVALAVVIPAFKQPGLLPEALESVLNQRAGFSIATVIVDDGCPFTETRDAALTYSRCHPQRVCYVRRENAGLSAARNTGIAFALTAWPSVSALYMLDADNRLHPDFLARAYALLSESPRDVGWIYPDFDMFGVPNNHTTRGSYSVLMHLLVNYCEAGSLIRRAVFDAQIRFDETMRAGQEDWDFWLQAVGAGFHGRHLPRSGFQYRKRVESMLSAAEATRSATVDGIRQKHRALLHPRAVTALAQNEMPDYALYTNGGPVRLIADPMVPAESRAVEADPARREFFEAMEQPAAAFFPPAMCFADEKALTALRDYKLVRNVFWRAQILLRDCDLVAVRIALGEPSQLGLQIESAADIAGSSLIFVRSESVMWWLRKPDGDDKKSVLSQIPVDRIKLLCATLPAGAAFGEEELERDTPAKCLHAEIANLRAAAAKRAGGLPADWRKDNRAHRNTEAALDALIGCRTIYPHRKKDGIRDFGVMLPVSEFGGIERGKGNYAAAFRARGWRAHLFITRAQSAHLSPLAFDAFESVNFVSVSEAETKHPTQHYFGMWTSDFARHPGANDVIGLVGGMDAIVNNHSFAGHALAAKLKRFGVKMFAGVHMTERTPAGNPLGTPHSILAYEHVYDGIIVISDMLREWCVGQGVPAEKLHLVRNAPSYPCGRGAIAKSLVGKKHSTGPLQVLYLGRLDRQKGLDRLGEIIRRTKSGAIAWRLVGKPVLGDSAGMELAGSGIAIEPPVHTAEELDMLYGWADVIVLTSRFEGVPLSILEAQRAGCAVLSTDVGAVSEIVTHGVDGLLVSVNEDEETIVSAFCSHLQRLAGDRRLARAIGLRAARRASRVRWGRNLSKWIAHVEHECETGGRPQVSAMGPV